MCNKLFLEDDTAALAYEAAQRATAGYEDEAWMIKHKPTLAETIYKLAFRSSERYGQVFADTRKGVRQLSGAWRRWWHERFQPDMRASKNLGETTLIYLRERKGLGYGTKFRD